MELDKFITKLNNQKTFRSLPDNYKSDNFLKLYYKMYEYMESIPKEDRAYSTLKTFKRYFLELIHILSCFLKAKDFNNWRYRIYELVTKRYDSTSLIKFELLYNSKAKEFHDIYSKKYSESYKSTCLLRFGTEYYMSTEEFSQKSKETSIKNWGTEYPMQSKEVQEKIKKRNLERRGVECVLQDPEVREKGVLTRIKRYGRPYVGGWLDHNYIKTHSKICDDFCENLYTKLPDDMKPYTIFYKKDNKEYMLRDKDRSFRYDFTISAECVKVVVEFDGLYWHGLLKNQKDVRGKPVEEIWKEDMKKQKLAESMGFKVIRVREDEYKRDKDRCIENVLKIIGGQYES